MNRLFLLMALYTGTAQAQSFGLAVRAGSIGPGAEISTRVSERGQLRVSAYLLDMRADRDLDRGGLRASLNGTLAAGAAGVTLDFAPRPGIRLSAGLWTWLGRGQSTLEPGSSQLGGVELTPQELGSIELRTSLPDRPSPFLGIGLGGTSNRRIAPLLDLGILFQGRPRFEVDATGLLTATTGWERVLEDAFRGAIWYPVATLGIRVRIDAPTH